jgi:hypothetical protein
MNMDAAGSSETLMPTYQSTLHHFQKTINFTIKRGDSGSSEILALLCAVLCYTSAHHVTFGITGFGKNASEQ